MKRTLILATALSIDLIATFAAHAGDLPDRNISPGAIDPHVTQENLHQTVCVKGYTKTVRPPMYYTNDLKKKQIAQYGYADTNPTHYEEDHVVALSIGGHPTDPRNLFPQPRNSEWGADKKDELELRLMNLVCRGEVPLAEAQNAMATNWIQAYKKYGGEKYGERNGDSASYSGSSRDAEVEAARAAFRVSKSVIKSSIRHLLY